MSSVCVCVQNRASWRRVGKSNCRGRTKPKKVKQDEKQFVCCRRRTDAPKRDTLRLSLSRPFPISSESTAPRKLLTTTGLFLPFLHHSSCFAGQRCSCQPLLNCSFNFNFGTRSSFPNHHYRFLSLFRMNVRQLFVGRCDESNQPSSSARVRTCDCSLLFCPMSALIHQHSAHPNWLLLADIGSTSDRIAANRWKTA